MAKHSATPWPKPRRTLDGQDFYIPDQSGNFDLALIETRHAPTPAEAEANAELIVRAVNTHDDLVAALKNFLADFADHDGPTHRFARHTLRRAEQPFCLAEHEYRFLPGEEVHV